MSEANTPAVQVSLYLGGTAVAGLLQANILSTHCFSADTFSATFAMGGSPLTGLTFWAEYEADTTAVFIASPDGSLGGPLIVGMVDCIHVDVIRGTVVIEGRDQTARLIDSYSQRDFVNQTASEVVSAIAMQQGLTPVVTPTTGFVGRYYGDGYTRLSLGQFSRLRSDWDLVVELARENQFDAFVTGNSLFFQPVATTTVPLIVDVSQVMSMHVERNLAITSGPKALIQSWNSQDMETYTNAGSITASTGTQPFLFSGPNLTSGQVDESASRLQDELQRLQTVLHIEMPWDARFSPGRAVMVTGTASPFDLCYVIDRVDRSYSAHSGATQRLRAITAPV